MNLPPQLKQVVFSSAGLFNMMTLGMVYGYASILTPALLDPNNDITADKHQTSWLASMSGISGIIPVFILGTLMHIYGRRVASICISISIIIGWILTSTAKTLPVLFVGRFLHSLGAGSPYFYAVCIGELSSPSNRSTLLNGKIVAVSLGMVLMHIFGSFLNWRQLALLPLTSSGTCLIISIMWPNTPDWLVSKGKYDEAKEVFFALRGRTEEAEIEIHKMIETQKNKTKLSKNLDLFKQLRSKILWRPVLLSSCGIILPEVGGRHFFPSYSIQLATQITGDDSKAFLYTYIVDAIMVTASFGSFYFVERYKRRTLILYSGYASVAILILSSVLMYLKEKYESKVLLYCSIAILGIYFIIVFSMTFAVAFILMGELLPLEYRALGSIINTVLGSIYISIILKIIPFMQDSLGVNGMFLVFAALMTLNLFYLHYDLPETKNRTLQDIGDYFRGNSTKDFDAAKKTDVEMILRPSSEEL